MWQQYCGSKEKTKGVKEQNRSEKGRDKERANNKEGISNYELIHPRDCSN